MRQPRTAWSAATWRRCITPLALSIAACSPAVAGPSGGAEATASASPIAVASQGPRPRLPDGGLPTLAPAAVLSRVPTRVRVPELGIDLAVIAPSPDANHFPACDVAEFIPTMSRPGRSGTTFIYAHARAGMFLPILDASRLNDGRSMIGLTVHVFTSDDRRFTYEVTDVLRHVVSLDFAYRATTEQLILQTSEGPRGTRGKTMLVGAPRAEAAVTPSARPSPRPVRCEH